MEHSRTELLRTAGAAMLGSAAIVGAFGMMFGLGAVYQTEKDLHYSEKVGDTVVAADIRHDQDVEGFGTIAFAVGGAASTLGLIVLRRNAQRRPMGMEAAPEPSHPI